MSTRRPPRLAVALLSKLVPRGWVGDSVMADLDEEFHARLARGAALARAWYCVAVVQLAAAYLRDGPGRYRAGQAHPSRHRTKQRNPKGGGMLQDLRSAFRQLVKHPAVAVVSLLTLGLGIGANVAIFTLLNTVLLRPLPYHNPHELVALYDVYRGAPSGVGQAEFWDWKRDARSFVDLALEEYDDVVFLGDGDSDAERVLGGRVSDGFFHVLGVNPLHGRTFLPGEDQPGRADVIVLGYRLWERRFGGNPEVIGTTIRLDDGTFTVVGVMPASFVWVAAKTQEFWRPLGYTSSGRAQHQYGATARLAPGVGLAEAQSEMATLARRAAARYPDARGWSIELQPLGQDEAAAAKPPLFVLAAAVGLVLLIACANVANLMLVRAVARSREVAIRAALGAGRGRLVRQFLIENGALAFGGTVLGLGFAEALLHASTRLIPTELGLPWTFAIDGTVLAFCVLLAVVTTLLFGLAPTLRAAGADLLQCVRPIGAPAQQRRFLRNVVVVEVALATALLVGAGVLVRNLSRLLHRDLGFRHDHLLTMQVLLPERYLGAQRSTFVGDFVQRLAALPGVESAAATNSLPLSGFYSSYGFDIDGRPTPEEWREQSAQICVVTPGYFAAMGVRRVRGRDLEAADGEGAPRVALINESMAQRYWPSQDPVGQRIRPRNSSEWVTVVGVVSDMRYGGPTWEPRAAIYYPHAQVRSSQMFVIARFTAEAGTLLPAIRYQLAGVDPNVPLVRVASMDDLIATSLGVERLITVLLGGFALLALGLATLGLYGVVAQTVAQRTREIGLRMALGARQQDVVRGVLGSGLIPVVAGLAVGLGIVLTAGRALRAVTVAASPFEPLGLALPTLLMLLVASLAAYLPAHRAARIDPTQALREE